MSTSQPNTETVNPLSLDQESYDILNLLKSMDMHLEAKEFEHKFDAEDDEPEREEAPKAKSVPSGKPGEKIATQIIKGRKIIRRVLAPKRLEFAAKVLLEKNDRFLKGAILNISKSGVFIATDVASVFKENETIRLYIRPKGMQKAYKAIATVMRFNSDPRYPSGYGLKFVMPAS